MQTEEIRSILNRIGIDTRNAVHAMLGFLSAVEEGGVPKEHRDHIAHCRAAANRLVRLVANAHESLEPASAAESRSEFSPLAIVEALVDVFGAMAREKGLELHCTVDPGIPDRCCGWPWTVEQVLEALLDNAVRFTTTGQILVHAHCAGDPLSEHLVISVSDTGPGLPADVLEQFESGAQVCVTSDAGEMSAGFGLAIARRKLAAAGGTLLLTNREGQGCEAVMRIGIVPGGAARRAEKPHRCDSCPPSPAALRILVAEDSDDSYALLHLFLKSSGHLLERAWNGPQAVQLAQTACYDLLLMDVHMPLKDGYTAAREIRVWESLHRRPSIPIVILSADPFTTQIQKGAQAGCSGFLEKPVSREMLLKTVEAFSPASRPA